jgi:hypothetical protein
MRNRRSGRITDNGSGDGADGPKHHRARQSTERGVASPVLGKCR